MELYVPSLIPYFINMCYLDSVSTHIDENNTYAKIKTIVGSATKVNLNYKILEDIAEQMVYTTSIKVQSFKDYCEIILDTTITNKNTENNVVEAMYFENNRWNAFEIDETMLIIIYTDKYGKYYVESEEYDNNDDAIMSYSYENNFISNSNNNIEYWDKLMDVQNNTKQKIYDSHMYLEENEKYDQYTGYFASNNYLEYISSESSDSTDSNDE